MKRNYTYKTKLLILAFALVVLAVVSWKWGFSKTLDEWHRHHDLSEAIERSGGIEEQLKYYAQAMQLVGQFYADSTVNTHERILDEVGAFADEHAMRIREYPPAMIYTEKAYEVELNTLVMEGRFKDAVTLLYALEHNMNLGRVTSVSFDLEVDKRTKKESLLTSITIQNLKPVDHAK